MQTLKYKQVTIPPDAFQELEKLRINFSPEDTKTPITLSKSAMVSYLIHKEAARVRDLRRNKQAAEK